MPEKFEKEKSVFQVLALVQENPWPNPQELHKVTRFRSGKTDPVQLKRASLQGNFACKMGDCSPLRHRTLKESSAARKAHVYLRVLSFWNPFHIGKVSISTPERNFPDTFLQIGWGKIILNIWEIAACFSEIFRNVVIAARATLFFYRAHAEGVVLTERMARCCLLSTPSKSPFQEPIPRAFLRTLPPLKTPAQDTFYGP